MFPFLKDIQNEITLWISVIFIGIKASCLFSGSIININIGLYNGPLMRNIIENSELRFVIWGLRKLKIENITCLRKVSYFVYILYFYL